MSAKTEKSKWSEATRIVFARCSHGARLSEFQGLQKRVAERLMDSGRVHGTRLPDGDYLLNKE